jgi:hypothetical protein
MKRIGLQIAKVLIFVTGISLIAVGAALGMGPMIIGGIILFIGAGVTHILSSIPRPA